MTSRVSPSSNHEDHYHGTGATARHVADQERRRIMSIRPVRRQSRHPALLEHTKERQGSLQNRVADGITRFAGSMAFVYLHVIWFVLWILLRVEKFPFGLLTMIVSLEAIFLSTFVLISQNRADEKRERLADTEWQMVQAEGHQNEQLISTSEQILLLTQAIHELTVQHTTASADP
jgi:uncharacterized membrane protein